MRWATAEPEITASEVRRIEPFFRLCRFLHLTTSKTGKAGWLVARGEEEEERGEGRRLPHSTGDGKHGKESIVGFVKKAIAAAACLDMMDVSRRLVLQPRALCSPSNRNGRDKKEARIKVAPRLPRRKVQRCMMLGPASLHLRSFRDPSPMGRCTSDACSELLSISS